MIEDHISLVKEPESEYFGHISTKTGNAKTICTNIISFLTLKNIDLNNILAIGCDGTAVNTGTKGGILEEKFNQPLQWLICQLHANELTLRHLFNYVDGASTGPKTFIGPIGKSILNCEQLPIIDYVAIECTLPTITKSKQDLSTDQLYLLEICQSIHSGSFDQNLTKRNPGAICHSRWVTTVNRILRLYVSTEIPSDNLLILANFILKVYAPMWFNIKTKPLCVHGAKHLFDTIKLSRYLPDNLKAVIDPVIQRNGFFGHSENILIAMLADDRIDIKKLALKRILKIRQISSDYSETRVFKVPTLNFEAEDYIDLIDWKSMTEPPLTKKINIQVITEAINDVNLIRKVIIDKFYQMPCHSQAVERCVKLVTEASATVCGADKREGYIKNKLEARRIMPFFNTKKDYNLM